ncbi:hypothetical protein X777_05284 [Ooceraea biroi]|uniref:DUF4817 domain-containing protein n=1 Tax=Ooceraea biroi TaxID=2015173 RepID=A0A026WGJ6_OOCBI|nr:hypothetical protein X777_05284 [Ooceraea biroi]
MADCTPLEIVDILLVLGESFGSYREAARLYQNRYPNRRHPNASVIRTLKIRAQQGQLIRRRAKRDYDVDDVRVLAVLATVNINPHISTRISQRTVVLKNKSYHPYHITLTQFLTPNDIRRPVLFCQWAERMIVHDANFFKYVLFSDESTF